MVSGKGSQLGSESGKERISDSVGVNPRRSPKPCDDRLENLAIGTELALFGFRFEFRVKTQEFGVGDGLAVAGENRAQRGEYPGLPVDQGAVAVESQETELIEVQHAARKKRTQGFAPWAGI